jgi:hypothetical protein
MSIDTRVYIPLHVSLFCQTMDDIFPIDSLFKDVNVFDELYQLVLNGRTTELKNRLDELPNAMDYLTVWKWDGKEKLSLLMVAALNGHDRIVRLLLTYDHSDEQVQLRGQICNKDRTIMTGVNALYCATYREHFHVAKTLIELGKADVNAKSADNPDGPLLMHAATRNRLDIVRFLIENRYADVNKPTSEPSSDLTVLMCAVFHGHTDLVQYLIDAGAEVNYCSRNSYPSDRTALMVMGGPAVNFEGGQ